MELTGRIKSIMKLNIAIFVGYGLAYLLASSSHLAFFSYPKVFLGIAIFFIAGFDCAVAVRSHLKLELDFAETLLISVVISLFLIPLALFLIYKVSGSINQWLNISVYIAIALSSIAFLKYKEKNANRKV